MSGIAIVGMACRYPDATSPAELWQNAIAGRRAFRRLPDVRMRLADYWDADPAAVDRFYARHAAVIEGYEFDRVAYQVAGSTYRSTDLAHWLALDVAAQALADAGFPMGEGLPRERTSVVVGNTLTGEFSRASGLRVRWPYVRRVVAAALKEQDWADDRLAAVLDQIEEGFKRPFPAVDEDTLAGGLSNTIAGRICNHFDLNGGGYAVDGACSSSLLSVATAATSLLDGDVDVALAGGVDLSIDPFEMVGFAKAGALAKTEMRVYDRGSDGFWPGEGCGMVVLMREDDARRGGHRVYATIAGWGISSDGRGSITRPEIAGYQLALRRAYQRAGFGIDTVGLFEGHGTGTELGDETELRALSGARRTADPEVPAAAIGSIKAMIGHTKAAAGVAGLIKATLAVHHEVLPPAIGCVDPHPLLTAEKAALRVLREAEAWPDGRPVRAAVSAMGFGGINTHVVLEKAASRRPAALDTRTRALAASAQDVELLLMDGASATELRERLGEVLDLVPKLSYAQLADLAATLLGELRDRPYRAAVVGSSPEDAECRLRELAEALDAGETRHVSADGRGMLGRVTGPARIGYLFPGQGSGSGTSGGALRRRLAEVAEVYAKAALPGAGDMVVTTVAQPRIVAGSIAGLRALSLLGLSATVAVGHSLGEISALHWAGAIGEDALLRIAAVRGRTMAEHSSSGTMASIGAGPETVTALLGDSAAVVAGYNTPGQTVVAGPAEAVELACRAAGEAGLTSIRLPVSHAFHSPLVAPAADVFAARLATETFRPLARRVSSTVTGDVLEPGTDLPALLHRQITEPVLFSRAVTRAAKEADLFVEVGPGRVLAGLAAACTDVPVVSLDTDDESLAGLLRVAGMAYVMGACAAPAALFGDRLTRPLAIGAEFRFFASPCEQAPMVRVNGAVAATVRVAAEEASAEQTGESSLDLLRRLAAERAELPVQTIREDSRMLDDLHLSSITVGQLVNEAARRRGLPAAEAPANFATATLRELADALDEIASTIAPDGAVPAPVAAGAAAWSRAFRVDLDEIPVPVPVAAEENGEWRVFASADDPLAPPLRQALERGGLGAGVLVRLPADCTEAGLELALRGAKEVVRGPAGLRFVLVQHGRGAAALARTLHQERPGVRTTVVNLPPGRDAVARVVAEVAGTASFTEAHYDEAGVRRAPTLRALPVRPAQGILPLGGGDVLLATGGGKGITADCALAIAQDTGAALALLGRSDPADDPELAANLRRMADAGVRVHYARADVTDAGQVRLAVAEVGRVLGEVTAVLHGAGRNEPASLSALDMADFRRTLAPKLDGLCAVLDGVDPERLRLLVTFGSIIGRAGLRGEAHYATANEWLAEMTREVSDKYPRCRAVCLEWSVWSGVGMGERLSVVEGLSRDGIMPITPDAGIRILRRLLADPDLPTVVVVSGRTGAIDTVRHDRPALPLLRFVSTPLVHYHGVELVTEVELNPGTDHYLADHRLDGNLLFPAVFGLEAMAQVARAVTGRAGVPLIERAEFLRPIVVPPDGSTLVRIAAVVTDDDAVAVAIRSAETSFAADHFTAVLRFDGQPAPDGPPEQTGDGLPAVPLEPERDLYAGVLFQGGRFQRLRRYHRAAARHVDVEVAAVPGVDWFAGFLPADLVLGDPGVRDALMHGNQVCVPDGTLLPVGVDRIHPAGDRLSEATALRYCATERSRDGDTYVYDVALRDAAGDVVERWEGLRLRAVRRLDGRGPWVVPLLGPYLERSVGDLIGAEVAVAVEPSVPDWPTDRRGHTALAAGRALGAPTTVAYRPDGRPEVAGDHAISASHGAGLTLCVATAGMVGCDVEAVAARPAVAWQGLLGPHAVLAAEVGTELGEDADTAGTRVWTAVECLQKAGLPVHSPLTITSHRGPWLILASGTLRVASLVTRLRDTPDPVAFAILTDGWA